MFNETHGALFRYTVLKGESTCLRSRCTLDFSHLYKEGGTAGSPSYVPIVQNLPVAPLSYLAQL